MYGDYYDVGSADGTTSKFRRSGRAINDDVGVVGGEFWDFTVKDGAIEGHDGEWWIVLASCCPIACAALGVGVDEENGVAFFVQGEGVAEVNGEGGFADAAFLVLDRDNHGWFLGGRDWGLG